MRTVRKVNFLIHPVTWVSLLVDGRLPPGNRGEAEYRAALARETEVRRLQDEFIAAMPEDEILVLFPLGNYEPMLELEAYCTARLGERCIILRRQPIETSTEAGYLPDEHLLEATKEILAYCMKYGYGWNAQCLKVLFTSRGYALDLRNELERRQLRIDPLTIESEAFGEGFEQCAMTWKGMIGPYLGWSLPTENNYELSVSGAPFLNPARFIGRFVVRGDIRLFVWEGADLSPIGLFARASFRMTDPRYMVRLNRNLEQLRLVNIKGGLVWSADKTRHSFIPVEPESLLLPVFDGSRRFYDDNPLADQAVYLMGGKRMTTAQFRDMLLDMEVLEI